MIPLKQAQETNFATSTRAELNKYAQELGIADDLPPNANAATIRAKVLAALGIAAQPGTEPAAGGSAPKIERNASNDIFPSYNLSPDGIWGGRRHRMSIPRPEGSKNAQAEGFAWNGKHTYYLAYDEVTDVPEPEGLEDHYITTREHMRKVLRT